MEHTTSLVSICVIMVFSYLLIRSRRSPANTLAWLLAILFLPYVGIPLFLILQNRKKARLKKVASKATALYAPVGFAQTPAEIPTLERLLLSAGAAIKSSGNSLEIISEGSKAYAHFLELTTQAKHTIHITTYILGRDPVGTSIIDHLTQKASQGVQVRLLIDGFSLFRVNRQALQKLQAAGGKVVFFHPRSNLRNHRKLLVIDGSHALVGGMNLAKEYMGPRNSSKLWQDLVVTLHGPAASDIDEIFASDWTFACGEALSLLPPDLSLHKSDATLQQATVQVVASGPDIHYDAFYDAILAAIFEAKERIWLATPYFIPNDAISKALELACRRDVDVRIVIPRRSDHILADLGRGDYLRELQEAGAQIFLSPQMLHAKSILFDNKYASIGSANLDMRSLFYNYELNLFFYSSESLKNLEFWFTDLMSSCRQGISKASAPRHFIEGLVRLLSPML